MKRFTPLLYSLLLFCNFSFLTAQTPFTCDGSFYIVHKNKLAELIIDWPNDTFLYNDFPNNIPETIDAIGYNPNDNFIYGMSLESDLNLLYQIDATGAAFLIDTVFFDHDIWVAGIGAGTFSAAGEYKILLNPRTSNDDPNGFGTINLDNGEIVIEILETVNQNSKNIEVPDIAANPLDDKYYGIETRLVPDFYAGVSFIDENLLIADNTFLPFELGFVFQTTGYFFDSFGTFYGTGYSTFFREVFEFDIVNNTKRKIELSNLGDYGRDGCSCPYTIKLNHTTTPTEAFPCTEVTYTFIFSNFSKNEQNNITFQDNLPAGFVVTEVARNPYGGNVSGIGTDNFSITNMDISFGIDSLQLTVLLPENVEGVFYNQATISDFDLTGTNDNNGGIVSNYPPTVEKRDSTPITIIPFDVDLDGDFFEICEGDTLEIAPFDSYPGLSFMWSTGSTDSILTITNSGNYGITVFAGCNSASANFEVVESPLSVDLGADIEICFGDSINLVPLIEFLSPVIGYDWQIANESYNRIACDTCPETFIKPLQNGIMSLLIENEIGCFAETTLNFAVIKEVFAPNVFSPNNDGINDIFYIQSKNDMPIRTFKIFDRWGSLLFEKSGGFTNSLSNGWNGLSNGKILDAGVYIWFAEIEYTPGEKEVFKGDILLFR